MNIFIGGAWPYANGSLHIGHLASLLGGDVLARYHRLAGNTVCYVSGSDCHGTPISIRAELEKCAPADIADYYHKEFVTIFSALGFTYDHYGQTNSQSHIQFVQKVICQLFQTGKLIAETIIQYRCPVCSRSLPDRYVTGTCPKCGCPARGDQCDACGSMLEPTLLLNPQCSVCGSTPQKEEASHLFLPLPALALTLSQYMKNATGWRKNAIGQSSRYLNEGLRTRAVTRDIDWGIPVPITGYEDKKVYVWIEAVLGYLSGFQTWAEQHRVEPETFWAPKDNNILHYYVHGKDNIPFHTLILPALLLSLGKKRLPDRILSCEYETLSGEKISTSRGHAVWLPDLLAQYSPDTIRGFFLANGPERKDADFNWKAFHQYHNTYLVGMFGNFVHRTLSFIVRFFDGIIPDGNVDTITQKQLAAAFSETGSAISDGRFRDAHNAAFRLVDYGNKLFDLRKPWVEIKSDRISCAQSIYTCIQLIAALSILLSPILPFGCSRIQSILHIDIGTGDINDTDKWSPPITASGRISSPEILYSRLSDEEFTDTSVFQRIG